MTDARAGAVLAIYQAGIDEGDATFETQAPPWEGFTAARLEAHRYGVTDAGRVMGWVAASAEPTGILTIQSSIIPENTASLALHRSAGFREVGRRERIGRHHGRWRRTILIERRSRAI